jgi:hypothetical protein
MAIETRKPAAGTLPPKRIKAQVLGVRLDEFNLDSLAKMAEKKGVGASTLARIWILERLGQEVPPDEAEWV